MPDTYNRKGTFSEQQVFEKPQESSEQVQEEIMEEENLGEGVFNIPEDLSNNPFAPEDEASKKEDEKDEVQGDSVPLCPQCLIIKSEVEDIRMRSLAEMDNFKKRIQREKEEHFQYAAENVLQDIIPAIDNLDLALQYANNDACKDIIIGIQMTRKLMLDSLKNHGLVQISEVNVAFDPEVHEAIGQEASEEIEKGNVLKIMQNGYKLKSRLLRSAKVIVSA